MRWSGPRRKAGWAAERPRYTRTAMINVLGINGWVWHYGGHPHEGWLPRDASPPPATCRLDVGVNLEIQPVEGGYLLLWELCDPNVRLPDTTAREGDTWHASLDAARASAEAVFRVPCLLWGTQESMVSNPALQPTPPSRRG